MSELNKNKLAKLIEEANAAKYAYWDALSDIETYIAVELDALGYTGDDVTELNAETLLKEAIDYKKPRRKLYPCAKCGKLVGDWFSDGKWKYCSEDCKNRH